MTAAAYDLPRCLAFLVPGATFATHGNDYALTEWFGPGVMPTDQQCADAWTIIQADDAAAAAAAIVAAQNESTLKQEADAALAVNADIISDGNAWLTTGPGAGSATLTTAQLSAVMRQTVQAQVKAAQQRNKLIRLALRKFDATT